MTIIEKTQKIIGESSEFTIAYIREDGYPRASTITNLGADGLKTIYASTSMQSPKSKRIQANPKVSLCFRSGSGNTITLTGRVEVTQDNSLRKALWNEELRTHYTDGPEGEIFAVFAFTTEEASAWVDGEYVEWTASASS